MLSLSVHVSIIVSSTHRYRYHSRPPVPSIVLLAYIIVVTSHRACAHTVIHQYRSCIVPAAPPTV